MEKAFYVQDFADWQNELSICASAPLCDIEAGHYGPMAEMLLDECCGVRRRMLGKAAEMMLDEGYPIPDVLDAVRQAMGIKL